SRSVAPGGPRTDRAPRAGCGLPHGHPEVVGRREDPLTHGDERGARDVQAEQPASGVGDRGEPETHGYRYRVETGPFRYRSSQSSQRRYTSVVRTGSPGKWPSTG